MAYKQYQTRQSGRYNAPGRFVAAGQLATSPASKIMSAPDDRLQQSMQFNTAVGQPPKSMPTYKNGDHIEPPSQPPQPPQPPQAQFKDDDDQMDTKTTDEQAADEQGDAGSEDPASQRPHWMKPKLQGVRKISNKERRRRQNGSLRRLLTPKNALMVLNEIDKGDNNFTVETVSMPGQFFKQNPGNSFCAALNSGGNSYKGYGENKMAARNAAAEQAVRDLLLKKMNSLLPNDSEQPDAEEDLPMIQLASFALHKLFTEWECQGHRVPQLRGGPPPPSDAASDAGSAVSAVGQPRPPRSVRAELPATAAKMHPCMLLSHMRPGLAYREVAVEGDRPLNIVFTMEVEVDGQVFTGRAGNKREARKAAAREACTTIFGVEFEDEAQ